MTQEIFPEITAAVDALQERIRLTEAEVAQMKEGIAAKKQQLRAWRKAVAAVVPEQTTRKKRAASDTDFRLITYPFDVAGRRW